MFERFTEQAREVVVLAQDEARELGRDAIGTEHLLLGLLRLEEGLAAQVLAGFGVTAAAVRSRLARSAGRAGAATEGQIPFTPGAKKVLELALREALSLGQNYIGTEHVLLGLERVDDGVAARILLDVGADAEAVRTEVVRELTGSRPATAPQELGELERAGIPDSPQIAASRGGRRFPPPYAPELPLAFGWALFAIAFGLGLLAGWLIWT